MKNLVVIHLESISNQTMATFGHAFPAVNKLSRNSIRFDRFFASATSSLMVIASLWHGNSFELDHSHTFDAVQPAGLNRNLYSVLHDKGCRVHALCLNMNHRITGTDISIWPGDLEPVWGTDSVEDLLAHFDEATNSVPFGVYFWNLLTHISNNNDETKNIGCLSEQQEKKYAITDSIVGKLIEILRRKNLMENTVIVVFGDHGDDFWTHGFKSGFVHAVEPYTSVLATPMFIYVPQEKPYRYDGLASTIDIRATILALLGIKVADDHLDSGIDLFSRKNKVVFAQSLLANQAYDDLFRVYKSYSAINSTHVLLATKQGLEFYDHLLDPANGCNLLHLFAIWKDGTLHFAREGSRSDHLKNIFLENRSNLFILSSRKRTRSQSSTSSTSGISTG
jgi:membrane-anchored protein YejM (alkaline phosphatase superfamily)